MSAKIIHYSLGAVIKELIDLAFMSVFTFTQCLACSRYSINVSLTEPELFHQLIIIKILNLLRKKKSDLKLVAKHPNRNKSTSVIAWDQNTVSQSASMEHYVLKMFCKEVRLGNRLLPHPSLIDSQQLLPQLESQESMDNKDHFPLLFKFLKLGGNRLEFYKVRLQI